MWFSCHFSMSLSYPFYAAVLLVEETACCSTIVFILVMRTLPALSFEIDEHSDEKICVHDGEGAYNVKRAT